MGSVSRAAFQCSFDSSSDSRLMRRPHRIMDAVLKHPDYKSSMSAKNADYLAYQDLKQV
jgi:phage pi2 protein 07